MIKVVLNGISGKMGGYLFQDIIKKNTFEVVAGISRQDDLDLEVPIYKSLEDCLEHEEFDTLIDFSIYPNCLDVVKVAILNQKNIVSGTTGYKKYDGQHIEYLAKENQVGTIISPNYSLMDKAFEEFLLDCKSKYPYVYMTESHGLHKKDTPSGTAVYLSKLLNIDNNNILSLRIPGMIASHTLIFSDLNQRVEISHSINSRDAFIKGIDQAIVEVTKNKRINIMI